MGWVIEDEGNKKIQSNFTQDLVQLVTQGQVKSSQSHHNFMFERHYQMSASISRFQWMINVANIVMVKTSNGKWRMCVDFIDLNHVCPKDNFPLLRIDQLVGSTTGHELLTFMKAKEEDEGEEEELRSIWWLFE